MERPARREQQKCEYCEFYDAGQAIGSGPNDGTGACRRYAPRGAWPYRAELGNPVVITDDVVSEYYWPRVNADDWCGEFERFTPEVKEGDGII